MPVTLACSPATCHDLIEVAGGACRDSTPQRPGFIAAGLHVTDTGTRLANCSRCARREDFRAILRTEGMRRRNREIAALCTRFEPVMYEVTAVF